MAEGRGRVLSRGWTGMRGEGWGQTSSDSTVAGCCDCENVAEGWWLPLKWLPGSPCYMSSITRLLPSCGRRLPSPEQNPDRETNLLCLKPSSLYSLGGGWMSCSVALCWSRRAVLVLPVLVDPLWVQQPFAGKGVSITLGEGVKNQPFLHWLSSLGLDLCNIVEQRKPSYLNTHLDVGDIFCTYFDIGL